MEINHNFFSLFLVEPKVLGMLLLNYTPTAVEMLS